MSRIFVSSTFNDLKECREKIREQLRRMGHTDVAMEYFTAEDKKPLDKCLETVASSDLYMGIFAWSYGYIPPGNEKSIVELEYRKAKEIGKDCLLFLLDETALWPLVFVDKDRTKIENLRDDLKKEHIVDLFKTCDELAGKVVSAVHRWDKKLSGNIHEIEYTAHPDINRYREAISQKYKNLDLDTLTPSKKEDFIRIQLGNVFVEQNVRERPPPVELPKEVLKKLQEQESIIEEEHFPIGFTYDELNEAREAYYSRLPQPVIDNIIKNKYVIILGDPGSGKSTLMRYILLCILNINYDERLNLMFNGYLPLMIELREFAAFCGEKKCRTFLDYFQILGDTQGYHLTEDVIKKYLKNDGKAVVIFDGLDEIFDPKDWENANRMIAGFALDYPNARIIVTSRIIGYKQKILDNAGFSHFTIQDFEDKQIKAFLDKWYSVALYDNPLEIQKKRERITKSLKESSSIRQLAGNPLLLTILAIIGKHQEIPRERWKLYDHAAGVLVEHWDVNRHLKDEKLDLAFVGEEDKKELLRRIAFRMQSGPKGLAGNFIHKNEIRKEIQDYIKSRYKKHPADAKVIAEVIIDQFRRRNFILCLHGADFYGFIHRTFLEYFCASAIVEKFNDHEIGLKELKNDFYEKYWEDQTWHEVLRLICGVKEKQGGDIIQHLLKVYHPKWFEERMPWNIVLAIKCLSELKNPNSVGNTSKELLMRTLELFRIVHQEKDLSKFLVEEIVPAVKLVGKNWHQKEVIINWISQTNNGYYTSWGMRDSDLSNAWAELVFCLGNEEIYPVIKDKLNCSPEIRLLAVSTLGKYHPRIEEVHAIFKDLVFNDKDDSVRKVAADVIAKGWHDGCEFCVALYKEDSDMC